MRSTNWFWDFLGSAESIFAVGIQYSVRRVEMQGSPKALMPALRARDSETTESDAPVSIQNRAATPLTIASITGPPDMLRAMALSGFASENSRTSPAADANARAMEDSVLMEAGRQDGDGKQNCDSKPWTQDMILFPEGRFHWKPSPPRKVA